MAHNSRSSSSDQLPVSTDNATVTAPQLTASCHCGRVKLELPSPPQKINDCRCTICYTYGALWTYYKRTDVMVTVTAADKDAGLLKYIREDMDCAPGIAFCGCGHCGCMTHWWRVNESGENRMGVNARMLPESAIEGIERTISRW